MCRRSRLLIGILSNKDEVFRKCHEVTSKLCPFDKPLSFVEVNLKNNDQFDRISGIFIVL